MDSVMVDLETMATGPNAAVIQVGFVPFNSRTGEVSEDVFAADVDLHSSILMGGDVDAETIAFWRDQGGLKRGAQPSLSMMTCLRRLSKWFEKFPEVKRVWAQGPSFDVAILDGYYRRAKIPAPWAYNSARDTRTAYDLAKELGWSKPAGTEADHSSIEDCQRQIVCLMSALSTIRAHFDLEK